MGPNRICGHLHLRDVLRRTIGSYAAYLHHKLQGKLPYTVMFGGRGLNGAFLTQGEQYRNPFLVDSFEQKSNMKEVTAEEVERVLQEFREALHDAAGQRVSN